MLIVFIYTAMTDVMDLMLRMIVVVIICSKNRPNMLFECGLKPNEMYVVWGPTDGPMGNSRREWAAHLMKPDE